MMATRKMSLENQSSFLRINTEKEKFLLIRFRNNMINSMAVDEAEGEIAGKKETLAAKIQRCVKKLDCVCCAKLRAFFYNVFMIVQSNIGLLVILAAYAVGGALLFTHLESLEERRLRSEMTETRRFFLLTAQTAVRKGFSERIGTNVSVEEVLDQYKSEVNQTKGWRTANKRSINDDNVWLRNQTDTTKALHVLLREYESYLRSMPAQILIYGHNSTMKEWSFFQSLFFCATVVTTIGYGSVNPVTAWGRIATMIYGCFGIPLCLIFLSRMGKLLTRVIKYLWSFIRGFYYTGRFVSVMKLVPFDRMKTQVFDKARNRMKAELLRKLGQLPNTKCTLKDIEGQQRGTYTKRNSQEAFEKIDLLKKLQDNGVVENGGDYGEVKEFIEEKNKTDKVEGAKTKTDYEVNDVFNLPPIIALILGIWYIVMGAVMYNIWEDWTFLEAFYFTFVSLSTIGFGDIIPSHPKFFLASFIYLMVGLALIAMVINVVMEAVDATLKKVPWVGHRKLQESAMKLDSQMQRRMSV